METKDIKDKKSVPFIRTGQALQSLRDSGYSIEAALGEVIDNSIEANANNINVHFFEGKNKDDKKCVDQIAIIDDGDGMDIDTLHYYPQIGFCTRYMSTETIGKYGVGAKLAALNFARKFEVWSKTNEQKEWSYVYFDLDETLSKEDKGEDLDISYPIKKNIPDNVKKLISEMESGTIILWSRVDRLEEGRYTVHYNDLLQNVQKEFSRMFRYFIDGGIKISVNDRTLLAHDTLYLMKDTFQDKELKKYYLGLTKDKKDKKVKEHYEAMMLEDKIILVDGLRVQLKVTLYPKEIIRKRGMGGDPLAKKLRVPENEGCISFVRLDREVAYTNVPRIFPSRVEATDRFIGIEVSFSPELDGYLGVRNVKRGVEPHGELRHQIREALKNPITQARKLINEIWGKISKEEQAHLGEHAAISKAASDANISMPKGKVNVTVPEKEVEQEYEELAEDVVGSDEKAKKEYKENVKKQPFIIESVSFPGKDFMDIKHLNGQVIIRLNTRHPFYQDMYHPIKQISESDPGTVSGDLAVKVSRRTIEAITLLLLSYGKAESMNVNPEEAYRDLTGYWGQFLHTLMGKVKGVV